MIKLFVICCVCVDFLSARRIRRVLNRILSKHTHEADWDHTKVKGAVPGEDENIPHEEMDVDAVEKISIQGMWPLIGSRFGCGYCLDVPVADLKTNEDFAVGCYPMNIDMGGEEFYQVPICPKEEGAEKHQAGGHAGAFYVLKNNTIAKVTDAFDLVGSTVAGDAATIQPGLREWATYMEFWCLRRLLELQDKVHDLQRQGLHPPQRPRLTRETYDVINSHPLMHFVAGEDPWAPKFYGICSVRFTLAGITTNSMYLVMENILSGFVKPCQMDIKLGTYTVEPKAGTLKKIKMGITDALTPTQTQGARMAGYKVWSPWWNEWKKMSSKTTSPMKVTMSGVMDRLFDYSGFDESNPETEAVIDNFQERVLDMSAQWTASLRQHVRAIAMSAFMAYECNAAVQDVITIIGIELRAPQEWQQRANISAPYFVVEPSQKRNFFPPSGNASFTECGMEGGPISDIQSDFDGSYSGSLDEALRFPCQFRSTTSSEHWYPQQVNPENGSTTVWGERMSNTHSPRDVKYTKHRWLGQIFHMARAPNVSELNLEIWDSSFYLGQVAISLQPPKTTPSKTANNGTPGAGSIPIPIPNHGNGNFESAWFVCHNVTDCVECGKQGDKFTLPEVCLTILIGPSPSARGNSAKMRKPVVKLIDFAHFFSMFRSEVQAWQAVGVDQGLAAMVTELDSRMFAASKHVGRKSPRTLENIMENAVEQYGSEVMKCTRSDDEPYLVISRPGCIKYALHRDMPYASWRSNSLDMNAGLEHQGICRVCDRLDKHSQSWYMVHKHDWKAWKLRPVTGPAL